MGAGWFFFQAEDGIRDLVRSRGLGDVYKRQRWHEVQEAERCAPFNWKPVALWSKVAGCQAETPWQSWHCLLYTSDAADERSSVDLGGRRIIKKKKTISQTARRHINKRTDNR